VGKRYDFATIADSKDFDLVPLGEYPARLHVDAYQHDSAGNEMLDGAGERICWQTRNNDDMWKLKWGIVNTMYAGNNLLDNLNFSSGGLKRVKIMFVRCGYAEDYKGELDPDDVDGTYWTIAVDSHELAVTKGGGVTEAKREFRNKLDCKCSTCVGADGKKVMVNARVGFAGFQPMELKDAAMYKNTTPGPIGPDDKANCLACAEGDHSHQAGKGCPCMSVEHSPF
jgi:hypothetical protein